MLEILDYFGISEKYNKMPRQMVNQYTKNPQELKEVVKNKFKIQESGKALEVDLEINNY